MRKTSFMALLAALVLESGAALAADAGSGRILFSIESQPLRAALQVFAKQTGMQVLRRDEDVPVEGMIAPRVEGALSAKEALDRLLANTGFTYEFINERTVRLISTASSRPTADALTAVDTARMQVAQSGAQSAAGRATASDETAARDARAANSAKGGELAEIVVTAQKRAERLIDVPVSMSVLSGESLGRLGATQFRDFANTVPGLAFTTEGAGRTQIALRGVTTGFDVSSTVGIYVDEVPYGSSSNFAGGARLALDVGLFDLDRIEVLRGPQGTLYGVGSMGGLLKYVTRQPDLARFGGDVQAGIAGTQHGGMSYNVAAAVNAPLVTDKLALRASAFESHDGGYIENLASGREDANRSDIYGGRATLRFAPTDKLDIRLSGFLQDISRDGNGIADYTFAGQPISGSLRQSRPFEEPFEQRFRIASGTIGYDLDWADLTAISSYQTMQVQYDSDISLQFVPLLASPALGGPYSAVALSFDISTDKFVQEVRLTSQATRTLEWAIGGFYMHETSGNRTRYLLRNVAGQAAANVLLTQSAPSRYEEYAGFGDLTWHLTGKFDVTGGVRHAANRQSYRREASGLLGVPKPVSRSDEDVSTYLASARYAFSDHATGYLRYATGYRPGGPNFVFNNPATGQPLGPQTFEPDRLKSYEIGFKAETADRRFGVDIAGYFIDWSNTQVTVATVPGFSGIGNAAGGAHVRGGELMLTARPTATFTATGAFAYQDAEMAQADLDLRAAKGERLPNVPRFTAAVNADYAPRLGDWQPTIGATVRHVGERTASFDAATQFLQYRLPEYTSVDVRAGMTLGRVDAQLYVRNVFDERGQLSAGTQFGAAAARIAIMQPRTIGISLLSRF